MSINQVCISGNLCRDAELRETQGGQAIVGFTVAVNDRRKNPQTGEWEDFPNYVDCTMFVNYAKALMPRLTKGSKVAIHGKLRWSQWEARDGSGKRNKLEVIVNDIETMAKSEHGSLGDAYRAQRNAQPQPQPQPQQANGLFYDDVPF